MSKISNLSILILIFLTWVKSFKVCNAAATTKDIGTDNIDITFLVTGGYRPAQHTLTKYLVSIRSRYHREYFGDNHFCGGCIIGVRVILTAAHCLWSMNILPKPAVDVRTVCVILKTPNRLVRTNDTVISDVLKIHIHPRFDPRILSNDIAIVKLEQTINLDGRLAAIIPLTNGPAMPGTHCTVVGWGRILRNGPIAADAIYADLEIKAVKECESFPNFREGMLCVSNSNNPESNTCSGDSGGPLICAFKLVGLVSYGRGCAAGVPSGYTDVWFYRKWIEENRSYRHAGGICLVLFFAMVIIVCQ